MWNVSCAIVDWFMAVWTPRGCSSFGFAAPVSAGFWALRYTVGAISPNRNLTVLGSAVKS